MPGVASRLYVRGIFVLLSTDVAERAKARVGKIQRK